MGIRDELRKYVNRFSGAERSMLELEARVMNVEFDLEMAKERAENVSKANRERLKAVFSRRLSAYDDDDLDIVGINVALAERTRELSGENVSLNKKLDALRTRHLGYVARGVCEADRVVNVPLAVYFAGSVVYANDEFDRDALGYSPIPGSDKNNEHRTVLRYGLGVSLNADERFGVALTKGKGFEVNYGKGKVVLVGQGRMEGIGVVYFLPEASKLAKGVRALKKDGRVAAGRVYEALKGGGPIGEVSFA